MGAKKIIAMMAGHDSKNPMSFEALVAESGLMPATLQMMLDQMFSTIPAQINRAEITRNGVSQFYYWPTGVVNAVDFSISKNRPYFPPYRRSENAPEQKAEQPQQEISMQPTEEKSRARIMLEYLADHGRATGKELCVSTGTESVKPYLIGPIKRGHVLVEKLGPQRRDGNVYRVAPGVSREELLADGRRKNIPPHKHSEAVSQIHATPEQHLQQPEQQSNVVEFKRTEAAQEVTEQDLPERGMTTHDVCVDADGQLVIQLPGKVRMVFPAPDTKRIKAYLDAIDLEALCA